MDCRILFAAFLYVNYVFCEELLPKPCPIQDTDCLNKATETFLEKTAAGIPTLDVHPLDPMIIPVLDVGGNEFKITLKNIELTGLRHQKISNFQMSPKTVVLTTRATLSINADLLIEVPSLNKTYAGKYSAKASPLGTAQYEYNIYKDEKGVEHFSVGPETTTCVLEEKATEELEVKLQEALNADPNVLALKNKEPSFESRGIVCKIVDVAYVTVVHNIRAAAKLLPKSAFFTNA